MNNTSAKSLRAIRNSDNDRVRNELIAHIQKNDPKACAFQMEITMTHGRPMQFLFCYINGEGKFVDVLLKTEAGAVELKKMILAHFGL